MYHRATPLAKFWRAEPDRAGATFAETGCEIRMSRLSLAELHKLCLRALRAHGLREPSATATAESLTAAEASGSHSHGVFRLQGYCEALRTGRVDGRAEPVLESPAGAATVLVNAQGSFAPTALNLAVPALAAAAKQHGVAACAVRNTFHFAALWPEAEALAERGLLALATVNSKAFVANASGGPALFGTNPIAFGCPRGDSLPPLVFDQACSVMARGDVSLAARDGRPLAEGVGLDRAGAPSLDAAAVLDGGVLLPFGAPAAAHKGANLALMVELLAGTLHTDPCACACACHVHCVSCVSTVHVYVCACLHGACVCVCMFAWGADNHAPTVLLAGIHTHTCASERLHPHVSRRAHTQPARHRGLGGGSRLVRPDAAWRAAALLHALLYVATIFVTRGDRLCHIRLQASYCWRSTPRPLVATTS